MTKRSENQRPDIQWTSEQEKAIYAPRVNLLVSAAAGSGKTAALTERIFHLLTQKDDPLELSELVAITFTRAAAASLKEKLSERLTRELERDPKNRRVRSLLMELPQANISTVHAFCYRIIRENAGVLGLPPRLSIAGETQVAALQEEAMRDAISRLFEKDAALTEEEREALPEFYKLLARAGGHGELFELPLSIYGKLRALEEGVGKLCDLTRQAEEELALWRAGTYCFFDTAVGQEILKETAGALSSYSGKLESFFAAFPPEEQADESVLPAAHDLRRFLDALTSLVRQKDHRALIRLLSNHRFPNYSNKSKTIKTKSTLGEQLKKNYDKIKADLISLGAGIGADEDALLAQEARRIAVQRLLLHLLTDFESIYRERKLAQGLLDYSDLEHYALEIVKRNQEQCFCRALFVDEYQDTNRLQDIFFRACVKNGGFFFFVGDVKQSIYRFRNAAPDVFLGYKNLFPKLPDDKEQIDPDASGYSVFFSENFRSDSSVIDFANGVFSVLMNDNENEEDRLYSQDDMLRFSKGQDNKRGVEYYLFDEYTPPKAGKKPKVGAHDFIAQRILRLIREEGYAPEEIAVIAGANSELFHLRKILSEVGLPTAAPTADLLSSPESRHLLSILSAIANPTSDIDLGALLVSPLFSYSADELCDLRGKLDHGTLYDCLLCAATTDGTGRERAREVVDFLHRYREYEREQSTPQLILTLLHEPAFFSSFAEADGKRQENLLHLYDFARGFCSTGSSTLSEFVCHAKNQKPGSLSESDPQIRAGYVTLMTVHKSKGLQFRACIFTGLGRGGTGEKSFALDLQYGFYTNRYCETGNYYEPSLTYKTVRRLADEQDREERKRTLYVGITRAAEKLILVDQPSQGGDFRDRMRKTGVYPRLEEDAVHSREFSRSGDLLLYSMRDDEALQHFAEHYVPKLSTVQSVACSTFTLHVLTRYAIEGYSAQSPSETDAGEAAQFDRAELDTLRAHLDAAEARRTAAVLPTKLSVSEILHLGNTQDRERKTQLSLSRDERAGARVGTAMHAFMQFCDFESASVNAEAEAARLVDLRFISKEQYELLNFFALRRFFSSASYGTIKKSPRVKRELRFNVFLPASQVLDTESDAPVLIQGVVDCYYENEDGTLTILDFKTDALRAEDAERILLARHARQLRLYRHAIEEITGKSVRALQLYAFALGREVNVPLHE